MREEKKSTPAPRCRLHQLERIISIGNLLGVVAVSSLLMMQQVHAAEPGGDENNRALKPPNKSEVFHRVALVIGNSDYINSPLKNPVNDAKDMAAKLHELGFEVILRNNLKAKQIGGMLRDFRNKLTPGAVALVFYAGHGIQIKGDNYLPAVDAEIESEEDAPNQSIAVKQIMDVLDESKTRLNLVFLDACRNNPYARSFRSAGSGLARVNAPSGTLISYATRPGSVAADGNGRNGLYTSKLLAQMDSKNLIEQTLKHVVSEVKAASAGKQEPWMEGSIDGDFCFGGCVTNDEIKQTVSIISAPTPVGGDLPVNDINKQLEEARGKWSKWQQSMKTNYDKISALNTLPDLQITEWERFLANYSQDNPYSTEDEQLRTNAKSRKQAAQMQLQQASIRHEEQRLKVDAQEAPPETTNVPLKKASVPIPSF